MIKIILNKLTMPRRYFLREELEDITSNVHYLMTKMIPNKFTMKRENFKRGNVRNTIP